MHHVLPPRGALWSRVVAHPGLEGGGPLVPDSMYRLDIPSQRPLPPGTKGVVSTSATFERKEKSRKLNAMHPY